MNLNPGFDPEKRNFILILKVGFLDKYFYNLKGMIDNKKNLPENINVKKIGSNEVEISFPLFNDAEVVGNAISLNSEHKEKLDNLTETIHAFINSGMRKELRSYEFIPLKNYPLEDAFKDIQTAKENKRGYCIIGDYEEYLSNQKENKYDFHQYKIDYGSMEWADFVLETIAKPHTNKDQRNKIWKKVVEKYNQKLQLTAWM